MEVPMPFNFTRFRKRFIVLSWNIIDQTCAALTILSAYHSHGKPGNSGENSNGTVHPGVKFPEKKEYLSRYYLFPVFNQTTEIFCTICLVNQCQASSLGGRWKWRSFLRKHFQVQYHLSEIFHRDFLTNGKRSLFPFWVSCHARSQVLQNSVKRIYNPRKQDQLLVFYSSRPVSFDVRVYKNSWTYSINRIFLNLVVNYSLIR